MDTALAPDAAAQASPRFRFDNSYARLPEQFHARLAPVPVKAPKLVRVNRTLAARLGLDADALAAPEGVESWRATASPRGRSRSPRPMRATSSAISIRSSATAARTCWAR